MRRVIYAWNYIEWGGAQIHFLALIREARKEFKTIVVLPRGTSSQFLGFLDADGIQYVLFDGSANVKQVSGIFAKLDRHWTKIKSEYQMLRKIEEMGLEGSIVHTDLLPTQSLTSLSWLCVRTHVFITSHNALPPVPLWRWLLWKIKFRIVSLFDSFHVFCTNGDAAAYFRRLYSRRVADDIKITYDSINPVEIDKALAAPFDRNEALSRLGIPTDKLVVLAVGQFIDRKGRWTFLDAANQVAADTDDVIFIWVTPRLPNGADAEKLREYGLENNFYLIRSDEIGKDRLDILCFFRVADVYALPSFVEGLPISLLEAMALGIPSISTNVYGIPEAIIHEQTGLLIDAGDAAALARSILRLTSDPELRSKISQMGRQFVIEHFDELVAARTALESYKAAFASRK